MSCALKRFSWLAPILTLVAFLAPSLSWACACGCGIFDIGTSSMFPTSAGGMAFFEYDYLDQTVNRNLQSQAPADANNDKEIRTHFLKAGAQYMFSRSNGAEIEVPVWFRYFKTSDPTTGTPESFNHAALGDIRINGIYTGLSEDMSTGLTYGLKLPTGDSSYAGFDPDTEIGNGSTDLLLGAYHLFKITEDGRWGGFGQISFDQPILTKASYVPGNEVDAAVGAYSSGWSLARETKISPILETLFSFRGTDQGTLGDNVNSGYRRLLLAPGVEADIGAFRLYADVEVPLYQYYNGGVLSSGQGGQLSAPIAYKFVATYMF